MASDPIQQIEPELPYRNFTKEQYYAMLKAPGPLGKAARLEYCDGEIVDVDSYSQTFFTVHQYHAMLEVGDGPILEFWDGLILDMTGGTKEHILLADNVATTLKNALAGGPCRAFGEGPAIDTPTLETFHFPDCTVVCGEPTFKTVGKTKQGVLTNPVVIVEVVSESSRRYDFGEKFEAYKAIPTFSEYLLIEQKEHQVTHWQKIAGEWISAIITDGIIRLASVECELKMVDIYEGV
jgi:Uma2 family endonuclease